MFLVLDLRAMGFFVVLFVLILIIFSITFSWIILTESGQDFGASLNTAKEAAKIKS